MRSVDYSGQRFGRLLVLREGEPSIWRGERMKRWLCACDCGSQITIRSHCFTTGNTRSCGCLCRELASVRSTTHGRSRGPGRYLYRIWGSMIQRCSNTNDKDYVLYGARGILVCERWRDFSLFAADVGERPSKNHSIDRVNNSGNYEPGNVRWATDEEQAMNRRNTLSLTVDGTTMKMMEWAKLTGVSGAVIRSRIKAGWTEADAVYTPVRARGQRSAM